MNPSPRILILCLAPCLALSALAQRGERPPNPLPDAPLAQISSSTPAPEDDLLPAAVRQAPPPQTTTPTPQTPPSSADDQLKAEEKQRLLGLVPAFNSVQGGTAPPLRPKQKFDLWFHSAIDPFTFGVAALDGGIEQAENTYPEYGQGAAGFGKRFGAAYADSVDGNFWGNAVLPVILHQDPRYFRSGQGSFKGRLLYAAISTVRCKGDNGKWQPSYSNIGGNLIGGAISNLYYPASDRGVGLIFERGFTVTAEGAFGALAYEFYPDAIAYLKRRHHRDSAPAVTPAVAPTPAPSAR